MSELANRAGSKRAGKKAEGAEIWIVFEEWIWDCVGYEGRWKEDMYDARKVRRTPRCLAGTSPQFNYHRGMGATSGKMCLCVASPRRKGKDSRRGRKGLRENTWVQTRPAVKAVADKQMMS